MNKLDPRLTRLTFLRDQLATNSNLQDLVMGAKLSHATGGYNATETWYDIETAYVTPEHVGFILSLEGGKVENYTIHRYIAVDSLSDPFPPELPQPLDEDDNPIFVTWQDVQDLRTVSVSPRSDEKFYFSATAHLGHRGLSYEEFVSISSSIILITSEDLPIPAVDSE